MCGHVQNGLLPTVHHLRNFLQFFIIYYNFVINRPPNFPEEVSEGFDHLGADVGCKTGEDCFSVLAIGVGFNEALHVLRIKDESSDFLEGAATHGDLHIIGPLKVGEVSS